MGRVTLVQPLQYKVLIREFAEEGWPSEDFVYDEENDLYRFPDGEFAFSREYANERRLRESDVLPVVQPALLRPGCPMVLFGEDGLPIDHPQRALPNKARGPLRPTILLTLENSIHRVAER